MVIEHNRTLYIIEALLLIILGLIAIAVPGIVTLSLELLFGWLLVIGGIFQIFRTWRVRHEKGSGWLMASSLLTLILGVLLLANPIVGILSLTMILMIYFFVIGISQLAWSWQIRGMPNWWLLTLNGILSIAMAGILWASWPESAVWAIGLLFGINLLFTGSALLSLSWQKEPS